MKVKPLNRRTFLRGSGACLALPFLEAMTPHRAIGSLAPQAAPPVRTAIFSVSGGTVAESFFPEKAGPLGELPSILRPFEAYKDYMTVISGLSQGGKRTGKFNGHNSCAVHHLTCAEHAVNEGGRISAGISVDQEIARKIGRDTYLPSLEIGWGQSENTYSYKGDGQPVPYEPNPKRVFDRMFRGRHPELPHWAREGGVGLNSQAQLGAQQESLGQSVLDVVLADAKALQKKLGYEDKQRLQGYMDSVNTVEKRISMLQVRQEEGLRQAGAPTPMSDSHGGLIIPEVGGDLWDAQRAIALDPELHMDYLGTMFDLSLLAFQTDSTRMLTFVIGQEKFHFPGVVTVGYEYHYHTVQHQGNARRVEDADPISREACRQINTWYATFISEAISKMAAIDDGGTSLLDNSQVLYTSYMADGGHKRINMPAALFGKAKGSIKGGQYIQCERRTPMANLYVEMLNRVGIETETFGDNFADYGKHGGRIPGLA